jgi:uncharacterized membrane-anchored protein
MTTRSASWSSAAVLRLRAALEGTADALASPSADGLLAAEAALTQATAQLSTLTMMSQADRAALGGELLAAWSALGRCRRLGAALGDFVRASFDARGLGTGYNDSADAAAGALAGRGFHTRA